MKNIFRCVTPLALALVLGFGTALHAQTGNGTTGSGTPGTTGTAGTTGTGTTDSAGLPDEATRTGNSSAETSFSSATPNSRAEGFNPSWLGLLGLLGLTGLLKKPHREVVHTDTTSRPTNAR